MASGTESPRQKMINLMYLVFIAMLALNMSKEVLSAFGMITEQTENNTELLESRVESFKTAIDLAVTENVEGFNTEFKTTADSIQIICDNFDNYISSLLPIPPKKTINNKESSRDSIINDYEVMDKPDYFNTLWFANSDGKLTTASTLDEDELPLGDRSGEGFIKKMNEFKTQFTNIILIFSPESDPNYIEIKEGETTSTDEGDRFGAGFKTGKGGTYSDIIEGVNDLFSTKDVVNRDGDATSWIEYHFFGFPEVASTTKLALLQSNIRSAQAELYSAMLGGQFKLNSTLANFDAYVVSDKSAYYTGSNFTGKIVLGKKSDDLKPISALINDVELLDDENAISSDGSIKLDFPAGSRTGTRDIVGNIVFLEDGKEISIPVKSAFEVTNKPQFASISADKMRVVYRGVENPISVSVSGIDDKDLRVTAPGLNKIGTSSYMLDLKTIPESLRGAETLNILVNGSLEGAGISFNDSAEFRIMKLPTPVGTLSGFEGSFEMTKEAISGGRLQAGFSQDFAYELPLRVSSFDINVPGQPILSVRGPRFNEQARNLLRGVRSGATVTIQNIKVRADGTEIPIDKARPLIIKIIG